ncbi:molybdopterin-dependent oxidoreductase [Amycolatopsis thermalba]|uniref:Molybdopterin-dependent oxidoreductase n=1 Tax=Amycolatopsis thermalba TaxID=944492 RepID=A0ABY4NN64_9PSEU|nr:MULTISPECIES: molybdopterin-dependent oxidoreductase [Amycolatopsis]UQS22008.1 molybdopterin-dependent oxidoreductase [Amycolatopsis thermalba]
MRLRPSTSHWGAFSAGLDENGHLQVSAHPEDPAPSPLLGNLPSALTDPTRIAAPAIRRGWLERGPGPDPKRGHEDFVEVGWDEALDLLSAELLRVRSEHGNEAIYGGSYGWASAGRFHHAQSQLHRFLNAFGGFTSSRNTYSYGTSAVVLPHVVGTATDVLRNGSSWPTIVANTELLVAFGGVPEKNVFVTPGGVTRHHTPGFLAQLADRDVEVALISPLRADLPARLDVRWYPIRPATDTALMLALAHTLAVEGLHDRRFLDRYCTGYDEFERYLLGLDDGIVKDAAWASALTDIPAAEIVDLARRMAARRTFITVTWSLQRIEHGEQPVWAAIALAAMLGQIGLPGGGFGHGYGSMGDTGDTGPDFRVPYLSQGINPVKQYIPVARIADMLLRPGTRYQYDGAERTYPDIRLVYWAGGNPFHHHQDLNRLRSAFAQPDTVVVHEPFWTATARHADIVLPTTTALEREDFGCGRRDSHLIAMHRVAEPRAQARDDHTIFAGLAARLGIEETFTEGRTAREWLEHLYGSWRQHLAGKGFSVPSFPEFWEMGEYRLPNTETDRTLWADFRADPVAHRLPTPSGRIEIVSERVASFGYDDCPGHPAWLEPVEWLGGERASRFPLVLIANQPHTRLHGQLDGGAVSQAAKVAGREAVHLHPEDAGPRGIKEGDVVRIFNDRGACLAGAVLTTDLRPGVVQLPTGAWFDPAGTICVHGNPNVLTADLPSSQLSQGCTGQHVLVEMERFAGEPPGIVVNRPPAISRKRDM